MSAVWGTIRDALKAAVYTDFSAMRMESEFAMLDAMAADLEAKLPLITPAHAAVIEAAKVAEQTLTDMAHAEAIYGGQIKDDVLALIDALVALRVQEAQP